MSYTAIVARGDNSSFFESFQFESSHDRGEAFGHARRLVEVRGSLNDNLKLVAIVPGRHEAWSNLK